MYHVQCGTQKVFFLFGPCAQTVAYRDAEGGGRGLLQSTIWNSTGDPEENH